MAAKTVIRPAAEADIPAILALYRQLDSALVAMQPEFFCEGPREEDEIRKAIRADDADFLLAERGGAVVGFALVGYAGWTPEFSCVLPHRYARLEDLAVDEAVRGQGVGGELLAANSILFQIQFIMGDILTGLSQAGAIYSGIAFGEHDRSMLNDTLRISFIWAIGFGLLQTVGYYCCRHAILGCFTNLHSVIATAQQYDLFIAFFPLISALGIVYYGVFNGALYTRPICISMLLTAGCYLTAYFTLIPLYGNIGLWLAFLIFYIARSSFLLFFVPKLQQRVALV